MAYEVVLNGITLSKDIMWSDRENYTTVAQETKRTLGGNLVIFTGSIVGGRPITLTADKETGWLTKTQVDAVRALSEIPGATYTLVYGDFTTSVMFRNEEPPAFSANPLIERTNHDTTDYFTCVIKLMEIN